MDHNVYINILKDTLKKKIYLLDVLLTETLSQEEYLSLKHMDIDEFEKAVIRKEPLIEQLNKLDDGFELIFENFGKVIKENKNLYQKDILEIQEYIRQVMQKSTLLQGKEKSNKVKLENYLSNRKMEVRKFKANNQAVSNYYKNMADSYQGEAIFLDKKK